MRELKSKVCKTCNKRKKIETYSKQWDNKRSRYYFRSVCNPCDTKRFSSWCNANWQKRLNTVTKARAKKLKREYTLTLTDINLQFEKQNGLCFYFNVPMQIDYSQGYFLNVNPSIDRINNNKGYTPDNIVLCTSAANKLRGTAKQEEFFSFLKLIQTGLNNK